MDKLFCESCGMLMEGEDMMGTDEKGEKTREYCVYCYKGGAFTVDVTMEEMIDISLEHMREMFKDDPNFDAQGALDHMRSFFPKLKRWA